MADVKISQLPSATLPVVGTEVLPIVQSSVTSKVAISNILSAPNPGNVSFSGTSNRITGDFSNATVANRVMFQTSTVNGATRVNAIPNGTSQICDVTLWNNSDTTNAANARMFVSNSAMGLVSQISGTGTYLPITLDTGGSERVRIDTSGNLIVGTGSNGTGRLQVTDSVNYTFEVKSGGSGISTIGGTSGTTQLAFQTNGSEGMRLNSTGLGIGTSSPAAKLHVSQANTTVGVLFNGTTKGMRVGFDATGSIIEGVDNTGTTSFQPLTVGGSDVRFTTSGTTRMTIASTGIVTMSAYGAGTATFSAAGVISSVSDETWKTKDGAPVDTDAMLKKLEPGYWYYNDEKKESFGADRQLGFYAQNVNAAIGPEAAPEPEEGKPWGYYDRSVLAVVVMSLQKALSTIESLETRLAALEQK